MFKTGKGVCVMMGILMLCGGCTLIQEQYDPAEAKHEMVKVSAESYHLQGQAVTLLEASALEEADLVYFAKDELELAKTIQYAFENGENTIAYQSEQSIDIEQVAQWLSIINPFDVSLKQHDTKYTNATGKELYVSHMVEFQVVDDRYEEAMQEARQRVDDILREGMSMDEKISLIHDNIILHSIYDSDAQEGENQEQTSLYQAAGVLIDGKGVCTGYSRAFMMMAQAANIPALYVSSEEMNHGWNYVFDGERWRYIDVTWDDPVPDQAGVAEQRFLHMDEDAFLLEGSHVLTIEERQQVENAAVSFF